MFTRRKQWLSAIALLAFTLSNPGIAQPTTLHLWMPAVQSPRANNARPLMEKIQSITGIPPMLTVSSDLNQLLKACPDYEIDHTILAAGDTERVLQKCDFEAIATADVSMALYGKKKVQNIAELKKIGYVTRTVSKYLLKTELNIDPQNKKLVAFPNERQAIFALFNNQVDSVIISDGVIRQLVNTLQDQVVELRSFKKQGRVYFLVSPRLNPAVKRKLQMLYTSNDPLITQIFNQEGGLEPIRPVGDLHEVSTIED